MYIHIFARCQRNDSEQKTYSQMIFHRFLNYNRNERIAMLYDPGKLHGHFFSQDKVSPCSIED